MTRLHPADTGNSPARPRPRNPSMNRSSAPLASPSLSSCAHSLVPAPRTPAGRGGVPRVGLRALTVALTLGVLGCGASNDCESLRICSPDKSAEDNAKTEDKGTKTDENAQKDDKKSPDNGKNEDGKQTEPKEPSGAPGGSGGHAGEGDETPLAGAASFQDEAPYLVRVS